MYVFGGLNCGKKTRDYLEV